MPQHIQDRIYNANFMPAPKVDPKKTELKKATDSTKSKKDTTKSVNRIAAITTRETIVHHSAVNRSHE